METISNKYSKTSSKSGDNLNNTGIIRSLSRWYKNSRRDLPWRRTKDPYKIWISEIILQQTRVSQGLPYYKKFIRRFPTVRKLAAAGEDEVLRIWQGLGYYTRARNLHRCAMTVTRVFRGRFPEDYSGLLKLPGIGKYTAAAIASIAFDEKKAVLDGNVFRVIARLYGIKKNIAGYKNRKIFENIIDQLIPAASPGDFNQAVMELGATVCKPGEPDCPACPVKKYCVAFSKNLQKYLPVNRRKQIVKMRNFRYYIIHYRNRIYMKKRSADDIWKGLYDFFLLENDGKAGENYRFHKTVHELMKTGQAGERSDLYRIILSHQVIQARFSHLYFKDKKDLKRILEEPGSGLFTRKEAELLPKPLLIDNYLKEGKF